MADNVAISAGVGTSISTEEVTTLNGGAVAAQHVQRAGVVLITADGVASDVRTTNPLPISDAGGSITVDGTFWQASQPVSGTVTANLAAGTNNIGDVDVLTLPALIAGAAIIGKVGIDQTTPGTTNLVSIGTNGTVALNAAIPTGANVIGSLAANQSVNVAQINGVTPLMGNGVTGTGSQRVTIASDNTAFAVNATLQTGANVIGSLAANQSTNVAQMNGVAVTMGTGIAGTGVQRVTLATDIALPTGANVIGALTANQSVNNAQIAGAATSTGNGVVGTGVQRVAIASDNTAFLTKSEAQNSRVVRHFILDVWTAAPAVEAMQSVVQWYNNAAVVATVSPAVVPANKILRLTGGRIETKALATFGSAVMRIRCNTAGTAVLASPLVCSIGCGGRAGATTVSATGHLDHQVIDFGDEGLEFPAAAGIGFSLAGYGPAGVLALQGVTRFEVWGYEYTA